MSKIEKILKDHHYKRSRIIQILQHVQAEYKYLPKDILESVSQKLKMPLSTIYSIATFYAAFSLTPRGKHLCTVCMGTACHVRGAPDVLARIEEKLGVETGGTTDDKQFTLETVNCLGACALAPIVVIDGTYHGQTTVNKVGGLLDKYHEKKGT
ncbi:MAG: NAD(P)H-dependent oxidoreductase subunit E [candidate division WOR-3 bacterium]|nr:MAG: NAD(P)H-dependent oxidoreductase subunit E [candidate division WOR-3 bacterium]